MSNIGENNEIYGVTGTGAKDPTKKYGFKTIQRPEGYPEFLESATLADILKNQGIGIGPAKLTQEEKFDRFARIPRIDPSGKIGYTREYIFFTRPDLLIFGRSGGGDGEISTDITKLSPLFAEANRNVRYKKVLESLSFTRSNFPFVPLLSNYKRSNVDLPEINVGSDYESNKNILGSSVFYRGPSYESDENHDFSIEFEDTKYLEVYMWFRLFDEYERMKHYGLISMPDLNYLSFRVIHDQMAMYKFIIGEDGESIIHYSKFIGVYPKNVPRNVFSDMPDDGVLKFTVNFKANFVEDMDPSIINEFNQVSSLIPKGDPSTGGFIDELDSWSGEYMVRPYIVEPSADARTYSNKNPFYKLKWEGPTKGGA